MELVILMLLAWLLFGLALLTWVLLAMAVHTLWSDRSERQAFKKLISSETADR